MVDLNDLNITVDETVNEFEFKGHKIEVKHYLPIEDKKDLIQIALQKAEENGIYNDILLDIYFNLNIVYLYSNINIPVKLKESEAELYDILVSSGLLDLIIGSMEKTEYDFLYKSLCKSIEDHMRYKNSAAAIIQSFIQDLPTNAAAAAEIVNNWDSSKFEAVQDMIQLAQQTGINPATNLVALPHEKEEVVDFLQEQAKLDVEK